MSCWVFTGRKLSLGQGNVFKGVCLSTGEGAVADPGFSPGGAPTPKSAIIFQFFAKNCMKMKEFGPPGGGRASLAPPLDPPMGGVVKRGSVVKGGLVDTLLDQ